MATLNVIGTAYYAEDMSGTPATTLAQTAVSCNTGDCLVVKFKFEGGAATTVTLSDGSGSTWVSETQTNHGSGEPHLTTAYTLSVTSGGSLTVTATLGASRAYMRMFTYVVRAGTGETIAKEAFVGGSGTSTTPASGNVSPTDGALVAIAGMAEYTTSTPSAWNINGVAGTLKAATDSYAWAWHRELTTGWSAAGAAMTGYANNRWCCDLLVLKATGGDALLPQIML